MKLYGSCQRSEGRKTRYVSSLRSPPPKAFKLLINNSAKRLDVFYSTGHSCKIKHYRTIRRNSDSFLVDRATTKLSFHRRDFMALFPCSLRPQPARPLATISGTAPARTPLCQGAAGGLPVPPRQGARGAAAEPGCTFKGPVAAGARLHSCSGAAAVPTRRARQPPRQPARPPRPSHRGNKARARRRQTSAGAAAAWAVGTLCYRRPGQRRPGTRAPTCRGTLAAPARRGTGTARTPRPGAGWGTDKARRRGRVRQGSPPGGRGQVSGAAGQGCPPGKGSPPPSPGTAAGPPAPRGAESAAAAAYLWRGAALPAAAAGAAEARARGSPRHAASW